MKAVRTARRKRNNRARTPYPTHASNRGVRTAAPVYLRAPRRHRVLALLLLPDLLITNRSDTILESAGIVERVVISILAVVVLAMLGWTKDAGVRNGGSAKAWLMVLPPLLYLA